MKPGDRIRFSACKTDGTIYRSWYAMVESTEPGLIVTIAPENIPVEDQVKGRYYTRHVQRAYYWFDRLYNLIEVFDPDGTLLEIYINIASPAEITGRGIRFIDHELDVSREFPGKARLVDQEEFQEAAVKYHYGRNFQERLHAEAREALELADRWQAGFMPEFGGDNA